MVDQLNYKVIVVGDIGVGKSSVVLRYIHNTFRSSHITTVGMDFFSKMIMVQGKEAKLGLWDASGREVYRSIWQVYYGHAVGVLLVFDITDLQSFKNLTNWYNDVVTHVNPFAVYILVGNKSDLKIKRAVQKEKAEYFAKSHGFFLYMETSALRNWNIQEMFKKLADEIYHRDLGIIYYLENQSVSTINTSSIPNYKEKPRPKPIVYKKKCCTCSWICFLKCLLGLRYGCGLGRR